MKDMRREYSHQGRAVIRPFAMEALFAIYYQ